MAAVRSPVLYPPSPKQSAVGLRKGFLDIGALQEQELQYNQWANAVADKNSNLPPLGLLSAPAVQVEGEGEDEEREEEEEDEEEGAVLSSDMDDDDQSYSFHAQMDIFDDSSHLLEAQDDMQEDSDFDANISNDLDEEPFPAVHSDNEEEH